MEKVKNMGLHWHLGWEPFCKFYYVQGCKYLGMFNGKPKYQTYYLHRVIMESPEGMVTDHIDNSKTLDNRKSNLRVVHQRVNAKNRDRANKNSNTGVKNVCYIPESDEYWVQLCINYKAYKWVFPGDQFKEACEFAKKKNIELYGTKETMHIKDEEYFGNTL